MLIRIYPENPNPKAIQQVAAILEKGGVIIFPTDTVYGLGCDIYNKKAVERVAQIKGVNLDKANFAIICNDLSHLSEFAKPLNNLTYKTIKKHLPGPFTFILQASNNVPKLFTSKKKTVGIRVPDNDVIRAIVKELGRPVMTTSIHDEDEIIEYTTDPELIHEKYQDIVDAVVDGGFGDNNASTVVDFTADEPEVLRQGKGEFVF